MSESAAAGAPPAAPTGAPPAGAGAGQTGPATTLRGRWAIADTTVRDSAKWIVTTITAFTGVVFAAGGFLVKGTLGPSYFWQRTAAMLGGAALAALGLAGLIGTIVDILTPEEPTLDDLPDVLTADIVDHPANYLPEDQPDIEAFRDGYVEWQVTAGQTQADAAPLRTAATIAAKAVTDAEATDPPPTNLQALRTTRDLAESAAVEAEVDAKVAAENFAVYVRARDEILEKARYLIVQGNFSTAAWKLVAAGLAIVLGAAIYTVAVSVTPTEPKTPKAAERPVLATLTQLDSAASERLWTAANLERCESGDGVVPVLLADGDGSSGAPWQVQTLPSDTCRVVTFTVIGEVGTVVIPDDTVKITYETTTTSTTTPFPVTTTVP